MLEDVANDLAIWIDQTANQIALAFAATRAPFAAQTTEEQKLEYYRQKLFNPDGSPNAQGRQAELQRLGVEGFGLVYKAIIKRWPELRIPTPAPIAVPAEWPSVPRGGPASGPPALPGAPPGPPAGLLPAPGAARPPIAGPPTPVPPRPPMMPPPGVRPMASGGVVTQPTVALIGEQGPEAVIPLADYQYQQPNYFSGTPDQAPVYTPPKPGEIEGYIRQAASTRGINPDVATRVAYFEGGRDLLNNPNQPAFTDPAVRANFNTGSSWWPFQLHYGGKGTPYEQYGTTAGLGNQFTEQTGYQPGDPAAWQASVDFALDNALKGGWTQWYGAGPKGANVSQWQGIPRGR
jgi:hypothetical protein